MEKSGQVLVWLGEEITGSDVVERILPETDMECEGNTYGVKVHPAQEPANPTNGLKAIAFVIRFVDALSLENIRKAYREVSKEAVVPAAFILVREAEEQDFKMSCPHCGQKLWIRDSDIQKRGRCPNCKKAFGIPGQERLLREHLEVPGSVDVITVTKDDLESAPKVIQRLLRQQDQILPTLGTIDFSATSNQTGIIEIPEELQ